MSGQSKITGRRRNLRTGGATGVVDVAVAVIHRGRKRFLLHYSHGWGEYTLPMVEIGTPVRGEKHFGEGEQPSSAACRAALKALPKHLFDTQDFKFLCDHNEEQFSKREGRFKEYRFHLYESECYKSVKLAAEEECEWVSLEQIVKHEPISGTVRRFIQDPDFQAKFGRLPGYQSASINEIDGIDIKNYEGSKHCVVAVASAEGLFALVRPETGVDNDQETPDPPFHFPHAEIQVWRDSQRNWRRLEKGFNALGRALFQVIPTQTLPASFVRYLATINLKDMSYYCYRVSLPKTPAPVPGVLWKPIAKIKSAGAVSELVRELLSLAPNL